MVSIHIVCPAPVNLIYTMKNKSLPIRKMQFIIYSQKNPYSRFKYNFFLALSYLKLNYPVYIRQGLAKQIKALSDFIKQTDHALVTSTHCRQDPNK